MKKLLLTIGLLAAVAFSVQAQSYTPVTLYRHVGTYTNCLGESATNLALEVDVRKQADVTISFKARADAASTANVGAYIKYSVDRTDYDAVKTKLVTFPLVSATVDAICTTNLSTLGCGWMKIDHITNAAAAGVEITNLTIKYAVKVP